MSSPAEQPEPIPPEVEARIRELQALITESHRKASKAKDEDIVEAHNLQISKLGLKIARLRRGQSEDLPSEVEQAIEDESEPLPKPTPAQLEAADKLIQRAHIEKRRGNKQGAGDLLREATEAAPGAAPVLEALGDDLAERRQYGAAREAYKAAHRADRSNPSIERKLAYLSMSGLAGLSIEEQLARGALDSPFIQQNEALANPTWAVVLSVLFPGLGQIASGQTKKGLVILVVCVSASILFALCATKLQPSGVKGLPTIAYFPLVIAIAAWFGGVADASSAMKSQSRVGPREKPNRPAPPVNLPFE